MSRDEVILKLAEALYIEMERLDPSGDAPEWDALEERHRPFYIECVAGLLEHEELILEACRLQKQDSK